MNSEFKGNIPIHFEYGSHNRDRRHPQTGGNSGNRPCPRRMPNVKNAKNRCRGTNCQAQCDKGFELPNGENTVKMQCKSSEWILEGFGKNDKVECKPKSSCPSKPDIQQAETTDCGPRECTVNCSEGHSLPDGSTSMKLICKNEKWEPADSNVSFLPHCECKCAHLFVKNVAFAITDFNCLTITLFLQQLVKVGVFLRNAAEKMKKPVTMRNRKKNFHRMNAFKVASAQMEQSNMTETAFNRKIVPQRKKIRPIQHRANQHQQHQYQQHQYQQQNQLQQDQHKQDQLQQGQHKQDQLQQDQ